MNLSINARLSVMMFLEFFIWGAWLPMIFGYMDLLAYTWWQKSLILNAFAFASFTGMFFSNQFADRNFDAEKFLAVSHLIGGIAILGIGFLGYLPPDIGFWAFFGLMLVHSLFYVPTISITNSIAFANIQDAQQDFPMVRLWGTIGWIAASWPFVFILVDWANVPPLAETGFVDWIGAILSKPKTDAEGVKWTYIVAGIASLVLAGFSLTLPNTPPKKVDKADDQLAWLEAMKLLAVPFVLVLFIVTFFDACVHQCYFLFTNQFLQSIGVPGNWVMPVMSLGQFAEIGTMAILGYCLKSLGWRTTMVIGILGHAVRFGVFALMPHPWLGITVILLHGVCYAFFFATVYIFVDEFFPKDVRTSAQGLFNFLILGLGPVVANTLWPYVDTMVHTSDVQVAYVDAKQIDEASVRKMEYRVVTEAADGKPPKVVEVNKEDAQAPKGRALAKNDPLLPLILISGKVTNPQAEDGKEGSAAIDAKTLTLRRTEFEKVLPTDEPRKDKVVEKAKVVEKIPVQLGDGGTISHTIANAEEDRYDFEYTTVRKSMILGDKADPPKKLTINLKPSSGPPTTIAAASDTDFEKLFLYPAAMAVFAAVLLAIFFHPPAIAEKEEKGLAATPH